VNAVQPFVTNLSAVETNLTDVQEDLALRKSILLYSWLLVVGSRKKIPRI